MGIFISFVLVYFKKFWGIILYITTLLWLSNLLIVKNIFSLDTLYTVVYILFPTILQLDALLKRDFNLDIKLLGIFLTPLVVYSLLHILKVDGDPILTLTYTLLLIYAVYLDFKGDVPEVNSIIKIFIGVIIPILTLYFLYVSFPDVLSYPRSQISVLLGITGLYLILYKIKGISG